MLIPGFYAAARNIAVAPLVMGLSIFGYTRTRELRRVPEGCHLLEVKAWGAGGGGSANNFITFEPIGGAGGYISRVIDVTPGDVIAIEVGGGGEVGLMTEDVRGGYGGWPDGGDGGRGRNTGSPVQSAASGGGGSTRLWVQGQLALVAAGGGGAGYYVYYGARGGGRLGGNSNNATGGTDVAGGAPIPADANPNAVGGYLRGGHGYTTTIRAVENGGGGGGGGYYGGGAGYINDGLYSGPGAAGSSWRAGTYRPIYDLPQFDGGGVNRTPVNITDPDYPGAEVGYGGPNNTPGRPGALIVRALATDPQPARLTHHTLEILSVRTVQPVRLTHLPLEVLAVRTIQPARLTQQTIEIIRTP